MTRKSRGTYVFVFGLIVVVGGVALAFLTTLGLLLVGLGAAVAAVGAVLLVGERTAAKVAAMEPGASDPTDPHR